MNFNHRLSIILLIAIFTPIAILFYSAGQGNEYISLEMSISIAMLTLIIFALSRTTDRMHSIGLLLFVIYIILEIIWGSFVPYILLLPVISGFVLSFTNARINAKIIQFTINLGLLLEMIGILPMVKYPEFEMTLGNYIIIAILLNAILSLIRYYSHILSFFTPDYRTSPITSLLKHKGYFKQVLIRGLYSSLYAHFVNNYINTSIWKNSKHKEKREVDLLSLIASTEKNNECLTSTHVIINLIIKHYRNIPIILLNKAPQEYKVNAQIFIPIIFDLLNNFIRYGDTNTPITIIIDIRSIMFKQKTIVKKHWHNNRSLGIAKDFLQLAKLGDITVNSSTKDFSVELNLV